MNTEHKKLLRRLLAALAACGPCATVAIAEDKEPSPPKPTPSSGAPEEPAANAPKPSSEAPKDEAADNAPTPAPSLPNPANNKGDQKPQPSSDDNRSDNAPQATDKNRDELGNGQTEPAPANDNRPRQPNDAARDNPANRQQKNGNVGRDTAPNNNAGTRQRGNPNPSQVRGGNTSNVNIGLAFGTATGGPLVISSVTPNSYFAAAGFRSGDRIVSASGQQFTNQASFYTWLGTVTVGQRVPIMILRNGQQQTVYWTPTEEFMAAYAQPTPNANPTRYLGIQIDEQVTDAVVVRAVEPNSPGQQAGVRADDVILAVNDQQVNNPNEFASVTANLQEGANINLAVSRTEHLQIVSSGARQQTTLRPPSQTTAAPAIVPVPVQPVPAQPIAPPNPPARRGLLRGR